MSRHTLTERTARRRHAAERQLAQQAVERLRSSEGWQAWLAARRHFHRYSFTNQLLIALQMPDGDTGRGVQGVAAPGLLRTPRRARRDPHLGEAGDIASDAIAPGRYERTSRRGLSPGRG